MAFITVQLKVDSPEKLAAMTGKDLKYFLKAEEFNLVVSRINLLAKVCKIYSEGELQVFKAPGNPELDKIEINDLVTGIVEGYKINDARYQGGDIDRLISYKTTSKLKL